MPVPRRLLPVKFRPYDVKLNPNNSASAADAARMILGNKGEDCGGDHGQAGVAHCAPRLSGILLLKYGG